MYSLISSTILRDKTSRLNLSSIDVAYMPMKTPEYESVPPIATEALSQQFPFFVMFTFLIPLYYLVSKFAEEKESKSREGMKMMGLKDSSYFLSWFVFYTAIITVMSLVVTMMVSINLFPNSNKLLIFLMVFFYGLSLFGFSLVVVSILPTVRSSSTAATLFHVITFFVVIPLASPDVSPVLKTVMSLFPNVGMTFCIYNLWQFEANASGLNFGNIGEWYNNMAFIISLTMLVFDTIFYICLGLYLDQIL